MWKRLTLFSALVLLVPAASSPPIGAAPQEPPSAESIIPPEAAKQVNPIKSTPASLAHAKKLYGYVCAMCHGMNGDGKGDLADQMKLTLKDWRDPASLKDVTDGELSYIITKGKGKMPSEGDQMKPDDVWNMVNYIRSFAGKGAAAK